MLRRSFKWTVCCLSAVLFPCTAWATQTHGGLEGLYVHQFAHVFFTFSMGLLIFWLRKWGLVTAAAWRHIQYAAIFFIAWNIDAIVSHWLLEQSGLIDVSTIDGMQMRISTADGLSWLAGLYYLTKLDHLLCVPALIFLFLGLRRLLRSSRQTQTVEETPL